MGLLKSTCTTVKIVHTSLVKVYPERLEQCWGHMWRNEVIRGYWSKLGDN